MSSRLFTPTNKVDAAKDTNGTAMSVEPQGGKTLDANRYATKKTVAQGMLDIALLTANASQLKYVLRIGDKHEFYSLMLGLIITSLVLQLLVGLLSFSLSMLRDCRLHLPQYRISALVINHVNIICVFIITALNILISGFGIYPSGTVALSVF